MQQYRGGDGPDADGDDLPVTWRDETRREDDRPCDRCPSDGKRVFWRNGREWCLCEDCYRRVVLGR